MADKPKEPKEPKEPVFRMVLVGKTGAGKSATGNTILGRDAFEDSLDSSSVTTICQKETAEFDGKRLVVVDTPGLYDTRRPEEEVKKEIARCISYIAPGPHVFLVVIQAGRFTKEEQETVKIIQKVFGEKSTEYTMVLFTHGDQLERKKVPIEKIIGGNKDLREFIRQCGGGYHVFNNETKNRSQVRELLEKINMMVQRNGGSFYTNEMLERAERAIQEKMERLLRENPEVQPEEARRQAERSNKFIKNFTMTVVPVAGLTAVGAVAGSSILSGVMAGRAAGPAGALVGGVVGLGAGIATAIKVQDVCGIQ